MTMRMNMTRELPVPYDRLIYNIETYTDRNPPPNPRIEVNGPIADYAEMVVGMTMNYIAELTDSNNNQLTIFTYNIIMDNRDYYTDLCEFSMKFISTIMDSNKANSVEDAMDRYVSNICNLYMSHIADIHQEIRNLFGQRTNSEIDRNIETYNNFMGIGRNNRNDSRGWNNRDDGWNSSRNNGGDNGNSDGGWSNGRGNNVSRHTTASAGTTHRSYSRNRDTKLNNNNSRNTTTSWGGDRGGDNPGVSKHTVRKYERKPILSNVNVDDTNDYTEEEENVFIEDIINSDDSDGGFKPMGKGLFGIDVTKIPEGCMYYNNGVPDSVDQDSVFDIKPFVGLGRVAYKYLVGNLFKWEVEEVDKINHMAPYRGKMINTKELLDRTIAYYDKHIQEINKYKKLKEGDKGKMEINCGKEIVSGTSMNSVIADARDSRNKLKKNDVPYLSKSMVYIPLGLHKGDEDIFEDLKCGCVDLKEYAIRLKSSIDSERVTSGVSITEHSLLQVSNILTMEVTKYLDRTGLLEKGWGIDDFYEDYVGLHVGVLEHLSDTEQSHFIEWTNILLNNLNITTDDDKLFPKTSYDAIVVNCISYSILLSSDDTIDRSLDNTNKTIITSKDEEYWRVFNKLIIAVDSYDYITTGGGIVVVTNSGKCFELIKDRLGIFVNKLSTM